MTDYIATYSPDDNKLRIRRPDGERLPPPVYERVRAAGYIWAPQQKLFVCPAWKPEAEDIAIELAGTIDDEDTSLLDRAEVRAERFEEYSDKRADDAERTYEAVSAHPAFVAGQAIHVGHHSARRAARDAEKLENRMKEAVKLWETSEYWVRRAKGAIRHAKYKELPDVRARRIKKLEAEQRKYARSRKQFADLLDVYTNPAAAEKTIKDGRTLRRALLESYDGGLSFEDRGALAKQALDYETALERAIAHCNRWMAYDDRYIQHLKKRLAYERVMLEDQGASDLIADKPRPKQLPLCNYRAPEGLSVPDPYNGRGTMETLPQKEMTSEEYAKIRSEYKGTRIVDRSHRVRVAMIRRPEGEYWNTDRVCVFLTDSKVHKRPDPGPEPQPPVPKFSTHVYQPRERTKFDDVKESLRQGVKTVSAPQLFVIAPELADEVIKEAAIEEHHRILEPSAGTGNLLRGIKAAECVAVEVNQTLADQLAARFPEVTVRCTDFLRCNGDLGTFDRIVMNPPFTYGSDIKHVRHAVHMLRPGGRLVAIMSTAVNYRKDAEDLRDLIARRGSIRALPDGSFTDSGTQVRTVLVTINA